MPQVSTQDEQQAEIVDRERNRLEDAVIRAATPFLLAFLLDFTNSLLGIGDDPMPRVIARTTARMEPALQEGLLAAYYTARQRSLVTVAAVEQAITAGRSSIVKPTLIPATDVGMLVRTTREAAHNASTLIHPVNRSRLLLPESARRSPQPVPSGAGAGRGSSGGAGGSGGAGASGGSGGGGRPLSVNQLAARFHERRLNLTPDQIKTLQARYGAAAKNIVGEVGQQMHKAAERIAGDLIERPISSGDAVLYIRKRLAKLGFHPSRPHTIETIYRTSLQMAYSAGQWESDDDAATQDILWGYTYVTVADDRVCPICGPLHDLTRPKDDPIWNTILPPNHYECRCQFRKVFKGDADAKATEIPPINIPPDFAVNWGKILRGL